MKYSKYWVLRHLAAACVEERNTAATLRHPGPVTAVVERPAGGRLIRHLRAAHGPLREQLSVENLTVEKCRRLGRLGSGRGGGEEVENGEAERFSEVGGGEDKLEEGEEVGPSRQQGDHGEPALFAAGEAQQVQRQHARQGGSIIHT